MIEAYEQITAEDWKRVKRTMILVTEEEWLLCKSSLVVCVGTGVLEGREADRNKNKKKNCHF